MTEAQGEALGQTSEREGRKLANQLRAYLAYCKSSPHLNINFPFSGRGGAVENATLYAVHFAGLAPSVLSQVAGSQRERVCIRTSEAKQLRQIALAEPTGCRMPRRTVAL